MTDVSTRSVIVCREGQLDEWPLTVLTDPLTTPDLLDDECIEHRWVPHGDLLTAAALKRELLRMTPTQEA